MTALPKPAYVMSEPHLSGWRVVLGYETLADAQAAQSSVSAPEAREGEAVGPNSFSAEGRFFLAVDHLTRMTWRWGESCGIDDVSWDQTGDSYNETCRADHQKARRAVVDAFHAAVAEKFAAHPAAPSADKLRIAVEALKGARDPLSTAKMWGKRKGGCDGAVDKIDRALWGIKQALAALKAEGA